MQHRVFAILATLVGVVVSSCSYQAPIVSSTTEVESQVSAWTSESLLRTQIPPAVIRSLGIPNGGGARVEAFDSPRNQKTWVSETIPARCFSIDSMIDGSAQFGDELVFDQWGDNGLFEKSMYLTVRTFPDENLAIRRMREIERSAPECGLYSSLKTSGESSEFEYWDKVLRQESDFILAVNEGSGYFGAHNVLVFGRVGSALYLIWLVFPIDLAGVDETISAAKELRGTIKQNLELAQR